jgi:Tol biopolymer transport system component
MKLIRSSTFCLYLLVAACIYAAPVHAAQIVYLSEQNYVGVYELFLADSASPGITTQLNLPLTEFSNGVFRFTISPDGAHVVFLADQDNIGDTHLYLVDIAKPGKWTRIGNLAAGQREQHAKFSPDGSKLAFTANTQLYIVDLANPGTVTRLNGDLGLNFGVSLTGFQFTPDGSHVVYVAKELQDKYELYAVDLAVPGQSVLLNAPGGSVGDSYEGRFQILPDSRRVIYSAVWKNPGVRELHMVSLEEPGQPVTLNAPLQPAGYVYYWAVSPDGHYAAYTADQDTDGKLEVFVVDTNIPAISTKINGPVQSVASLAAFTPDSKRIIYSGDEERDIGARDLYSVLIEKPMTRERLNAPLPEGVDINAFTVSSNGAHVVYKPEPPDGSWRDLMLVQLSKPGTAVKINGPMPNGVLDRAALFSQEGEMLAFLAVESFDSGWELFFARVSDPGISIRLNGPLVPGGGVLATPGSFEWVPEDPGFLINAGLNDAWYNPVTNGQGFFITVFPNLGAVSLAWFTYDTELPAEDATANLGDPGHRWLTAVGPISGNQVNMQIEMTSGGLFDTTSIIERTDPAGSDGTIILTFDSCNSGTIEYDIPSIDRQGIIPIVRVANDNIVICEALSAD